MKNKKINIELTDILIFSIIIIVFGIALLSFFPGLLTSDSVDQIQQAKDNNYSSGHPIIHSFLVGNLTKLGGIWVPALFQIMIFAIIWTYGCKLIRKYNDTRKNKIFQVIITFIISIIPLNFLYAITLWKDILYSYSIFAILIFVYVGIKEKYKFTIPQLILIGISTVAIMKFRHNGAPIGFIIFILLLFLNFKNNKKLKQSFILIASFVVTFVLMSIPQWIFVKKTTATEGGSVLNATKVYCLGALFNTDIELEDDEKDFLNTIFDIEKWKEGYNPYTASGIVYNKEFDHTILTTKEASEKLNDIFVKYAKQKPLVVIKHFMDVNSIWWSIPELGRYA